MFEGCASALPFASIGTPKANVTERPLIVLSLEGLARSALGCYGSSWNRTPAIDAIAGTGCVWDRWIATSDDPAAVLRGTIDSAPSVWADAWRARGSVELLTDVPALVDGLSCPSFDRVDAIEMEQPSAIGRPVSELAESQLGQLLAAAIERASQADPWSLLWLHSGFLTRRWDAPRDLFAIDEPDDDLQQPDEEVELLAVESNRAEELERLPPIFPALIPPQIAIDNQTHPDLVTSWMRTYGCQICLLDLLIEVLMRSLRSRHDPESSPYVVLLGTSGFRLGQGGWLGHRPENLRSADLHLPMIVSDHGPLRVAEVTSSDALPDILRDLGKGPGPLISADRWSEPKHASQVVTKSGRAQYSVTTSRWFFVRDNDSSEHLFLKPDDVEDFNDVGRLRKDIVQQLSDTKK